MALDVEGKWVLLLGQLWACWKAELKGYKMVADWAGKTVALMVASMEKRMVVGKVASKDGWSGYLKALMCVDVMVATSAALKVCEKVGWKVELKVDLLVDNLDV